MHEGTAAPLGVTWVEKDQAYNFSIYSENASAVTLLLYAEDDFVHPKISYHFDPLANKTSRVWHCRIQEKYLANISHYAYSIDGPAPEPPSSWHAFDPQKILLDPYAHSVFFPPGYERAAASPSRPGSNAGKAPLGVFRLKEPTFDWSGDRSPRHYSDLIIYEMHVRGFTRSPSSGIPAQKQGTFAGIIEKIPYLKELGVTALELMPIHQFDPQENNYWGYMTLNFFSPHLAYAADPQHPKNEFRAMVKALHAADIEVILDVVYNHTSEGGKNGPNYSFKGIDNSTFYLMSDDPEHPYLDHSGTGNTLNCADPFVRTMILDSLRYWVTEMHVDGFRFDLASVLSRDPNGSLTNEDSPLITAIRTDPILSDVYLIAEPWDASGAYQLGTHFPGRLWQQWNGKFRDDVRRFVRGDEGMVSRLMQRIYGSDDLFPDSLHEARRPFFSINYVICHDGFTLNDIVSYNERRNLANGHDNTDGTANNYSWNCGHEGEENTPDEVRKLRRRQAKNLFTLLMLSNGIPMFCAGDEFLHTQHGNNNPYNQDNETTWLNWDRLEQNRDMFRFCRELIAFRKSHPTLCRSRFWRDDVRWYGEGKEVNWEKQSHVLSYCLHGASLGDADLYVMINASKAPVIFTIQEGQAGSWVLVLDTSLESPEDISIPGHEPAVPHLEYTVESMSTVVLMSSLPKA